MRFELLPFQPVWLADLTLLINAHTSLVPPGWTLTDAQVDLLLAAPFWWQVHYPDQTRLADAEVLCVLEDGNLCAGTRLRYSDDRCTYITWILSKPESGDAFRYLLEEVETRARARGCQSLRFTRNELGAGWFDVPVVWPHIVQGLHEAGFEVEREWMLMSGKVNRYNNPMPDVQDLTLEWDARPQEAEWKVTARADGMLLGECEAWGIPAAFHGCSGYDEWITLEWLGVEEPYRRKGIGRWLMNEQLQFQAGRGIGKALMWTEIDNEAAIRLNEQMGFSRGPVCLQYRSRNLR
jgi:GNAT superfamily N-acetyltransferase